LVGQETGQTAAGRVAQRNFDANLAALARRQRDLAAALGRDDPADLEWVLGRDGSLTARFNGAWWSRCSLPRRAAEAVMGRMELRGQVACLVAPSHAAQVRAALERMAAGQALIAIVPDEGELRIALGCEDFAGAIGGGRLRFVTGENWSQDLASLLIEHDGLPTPSQFVRTSLSEAESLDALIAAADAVIQRENARRSELVRSILATNQTARGTILAVLSSQFRLWDDAGETLGQIAGGAGWRALDVADPCSGSAVALARAAARCRAVVIANAGRADLGAALPAEAAVMSWITSPRVPTFDPRFARDGLILVDSSWLDSAVRAGWPRERLAVAAWPPWEPPSPGGRGLVIIADTVALAAPEFEFSSHRLLWDTIAAQLAADPFALGRDVTEYLSRCCAKTGIDPQTLDRRLFAERLIVPAYQQGLTKLLAGAGIELRLLGRGWDRVEGLAERHAGEIHDRAELRAAVAGAAALVHAWPANWAHPIDAAAKPVLRARGSKSQWLSEARRLAAGSHHFSNHTAAPALNASLIERMLR
jgi:hypothetical protein